MEGTSLTDYFQEILRSTQEFVDTLPKQFLDDHPNTIFQLMSEIQVYMRTPVLNEEDQAVITRKTEELMEGVEQLELAYQDWELDHIADGSLDELDDEFDHLMDEPTFAEQWHYWMGWQYRGTAVVRTVLKMMQVPVLVGVIGLVLCMFSGVVVWDLIEVLMVSGLIGLVLVLGQWIVRMGWLFVIIILTYISLGI